MADLEEIEVYRALLVVLTIVCVFLWWRLENLKQQGREGHPKPGSALTSSHGSVGFEAADEPGTTEYTYDDPDFALPPLVPGVPVKGRVEAEHGDAVYGNEKRYNKDDYIGRVSHGADLELMDCRVYMNEFKLNIIKVRVATNQWPDEVGRIGWVGLDDTSYRSGFDPKTRTIQL